MKIASLPVLLALLASAASPQSQDPFPEEMIESLVEKGFSGEPYDLAGNRIVFTNWYFIRPGNLHWLNEEGERVNTLEEPVYGPWDATISRPSSPFGIELVTHQAERGPRIEREKPWESEYIRLRTVMKEGDRYRAWGQCSPGGHCYFESKDGIHWDRPLLGLVEFEGSKDNNLLRRGPVGCVFIDPSAPPESRYKSVGGTHLTLEEFQAFSKKHPDKWDTRGVRLDKAVPEVKAVRGAYSADGIHWERLPEILTAEHSDGMESGFFDPVTEKYLIYVRNWYVGPRSRRWRGDVLTRTWLGEFHGSGRRSIGMSVSETFEDFPLTEPVIIPTAGDTSPSEVFYTSPHTTIPGAPDHHLMFPSIWDTRDDTTSLGLWSSPNGRNWERVPGPRVFETAPFGNWDGGCFWAFPDLIERADGGWALPYRGYNLPHKYPRGTLELYAGFMVWPKGRMVAVEADDIGEFATVGILPPGRTLRLNALTKRAGGIWVEIATLQDEILPGRGFEDCQPIQGDQFWTTVAWNGEKDLGFEEGQGIVIRFRMDRAKLFGIEFQ